LRYEVLTGLRHEQLQELLLRILGRAGDVVRAGGRPAAIGLLGSVAMVVTLMRKNITQEVAGALFGVSQATVSRRWDLLRPLLADGTVCPVWDWSAIPGLFSGKAGYPGMNVQIAATMGGDLAAAGPMPVRGARHDAHAFEASGLKDLIAGMDAAVDLGYTGIDGIAIVPFRTPPGGKLHDSKTAFNTGLSAIRAAVERAVAHLKTWRMLSEEGGRFRPPLAKFKSALTAIIGLFFFSNYYEAYE
jgi:hypothetical protein